MSNLTPQEFVAKWRDVTLKERSGSQEHFIDLCRLLDHPTPAEADPTGEKFTFEAGADKTGGGKGWADVWKRGHFAWEYKGKHADLDKAYEQLLKYREALENPPLLVVSDMEQIIIHTNFTNTIKRIERLDLDDLLDPERLALLQATFTAPDNLKISKTTAQVTAEAAAEFAKLADLLRKYGEDPQQIAHFLTRLLFCLFAEDINLLPRDIFTRLVTQTRRNSAAFAGQLRQLFGAMAHGGWFGADQIAHFDGGLFEDEFVLELDSQGLDTLVKVAALDWSSIEPSILGTLFERSLDPAKRSQLGAHYTSKEDILLIVEPVLMAPLRRRWAEVKAEAEALAERRDQAKRQTEQTKLQNQLSNLLLGFAEELTQVRVLDPACGSGNFLYVALKELLDLWKQVSLLAGELGLPLFNTVTAPSPLQLYGIELNPYAHELAQATVWIGYIQWLRENGFGRPSEPILKPLHNIRQMDAILAYDEAGQPVEPEWPEADVVIGNPPFLGGNRIRQELGDDTVDALFQLYHQRIPAFADLVCYWFERTRALIELKLLKRAGLLATNSIRGGVNRRVLERIKESGDIFMAWSDRPWVLEGAAVRVSIIGFDDGSIMEKELNGIISSKINPDLTSIADLSIADKLKENVNLCFYGSQQKGSFDITPQKAQELLSQHNSFGLNNQDVIKRSVNAMQILRRTDETWVIDFGVMMSIEDAALYEAPFEYVREVVYPERKNRREKRQREYWWLHARPSPRYREILSKQNRYVVSPAVAKHRIFVWLDNEVLVDHANLVYAREDDYFFGVLHSKLHELWALRQGTSLEDRPRYTPTTTFETFPFPWPPGQEPLDDPRVQAIAEAARSLVEKRDNWLNPEGADEKELKKRTLTNLYNQRPTWLDLAHQTLDRAVLDAYGWPHDVSDEEILERLLALNLARAGEE